MLESTVDLHMHSTASDGRLSPAAVVQRAADAGVGLMSLTDHDTLDGVVEARTAAADAGIRCLPGIELSARWARGVVHIVGLGVDIDNRCLRDGVAGQQQARLARAWQIVTRLERAGIEDLQKRLDGMVGEGVPGRAHVARCLVQAGHARDNQQAFDRFLQRGRPGYAPVSWASIDAVVDWIGQAGGIAVFAHPLRYRISRGALRAAISAFVEAGGTAIEVSNAGGGRDDLAAAAALARRFALKASMGSDFHDPDFPWIQIGRLAPLPRDLTPVWEDLEGVQ
jgi:hypothetical protein